MNLKGKMMIDREFSPLKRKSQKRSPDLVVIATEGSKTEPKYFEALKIFTNNSTIKIFIIKDPGTDRDPKQVMRRLDEYVRKNKIRKSDQLWLVIDTDCRNSIYLDNVSTEAINKGYHLAISNPCIELWFLLHFITLDQCTEEEISNFHTPKAVLHKLRNVAGGYKKSRPPTKKLLDSSFIAIQRARGLYDPKEDIRPKRLGTHVFRLVEVILNYKGE